MFKHTITIAASVFIALNATARLHAQTDPNRRIMAVSVTDPVGAPAGGSATRTVRAFVTAEASADLSAPQDLSMRVEFRLNGAAVGDQIVPVEASPSGPGGGTCGDLPCLVGETCYCHGLPPECDCDVWYAAPEQEMSLEPGDVIEVILFPAPGAAPEADASDDAKLTAFEGEDIFWDRRIEDVRIVPSAAPGGPASAGDSFFDIWVDVALAARYDGALEIPLDLAVHVNGEPLANASFPDVPDTILAASCSQLTFCGAGNVCELGDLDSLCGVGSGEYTGCVCFYQSGLEAAFFAVPLDPGDEVVVLLRPAPGALPELPGFPENDEGGTILCPGDTNGDGQVDIDDVVNVVLDFGTDGSEHGGDVDDGTLTGTPDGTVNIDDVVFAILEFGSVCGGPM